MTNATPHDILSYWIGEARNDAKIAAQKNKLWFVKSDDTDDEIRTRFSDTLIALKDGQADNWAARGADDRLAAIIVLDQFSRNIHRGNAKSFSQDAQALALCKAGLAVGDDKSLSEVERVFFYLPLEHSEMQEDQAASIAEFTQLHADARPEFKSFAKNTLDYAHAHKKVIDQFGRFPHRNKILNRTSTPEEMTYLQQPGSGF
jgi:uncharacterized protein (DUF924 family)